MSWKKFLKNITNNFVNLVDEWDKYSIHIDIPIIVDSCFLATHPDLCA